MDLEEIFRYDSLIFCPTTFNFTFHIPNRGQRMDRTFEVIFKDSQKSYAVYLTHMLFTLPYNQATHEAHTDSNHQTNRWSLIVIIMASCLIALLVMNLVYAYLQLTKSRVKQQRKSNSNHKIYKYYKASISQETQQYRLNENVKSAGSPKPLTECQYLCIVCYVVVRVVYSLLFSFTVFLAILVVVLESDTYHLQNIPQFQRLRYNETHHYATSINKHAYEELLRQSDLVTSMQGACSNYIQELFVTVQSEIENASMRAQYSQMYSTKSSISWYVKDLVDTRLKEYFNETQTFTLQFYTNFTKRVDPSLHSYGMYLLKVFDNHWFQFSQELFNNSQFGESRSDRFNESIAHGIGFDFGAFLEIEEVEQIQRWPMRWWEK